MLYSTPNVSQAYRTVPLDVNTPICMRGPGFASGVLRHRVGHGRTRPRARHRPDRAAPAQRTRPRTSRPSLPFSTRRLRECYTVGAREFGWHRRNPKPRSTRDGDWLIGTGHGRRRLRHRAHARPRPGSGWTPTAPRWSRPPTSDMGPGTYTSQTQVAADALGLTMRTVTFRLGDSLHAADPAARRLA